MFSSEMGILKIIFIFVFFTLSFSALAADYEYNYGNPLIDAADSGNEYLVLSHITKGVSVNSKGSFGTTALMRATIKGHDVIVKRLLDAGADVNARDVGGATALHLAARTGNVRISEILLKRGADPDASDVDGYTPLQRATQTQYAAVINAMLESGTVNVHQKNKEGLSALDIAHKTKNQKVIDLMSQKVADQSQSQMLEMPNKLEVSKAEAVNPIPVEEIKTEPMSALMPDVVVEEKKIAKTQESTKYDANKDLVKDLRAVIQNKKKEIFVPNHPHEIDVIESEPESKDEESEKTKAVKVSVAEAIKIPDEVDLRDGVNQLRIKKAGDDNYSQASTTQKEAVAEVSQSFKNISMEVSYFNTEEDGVAFWDKVVSSKDFKGKDAELIEDSSDVLPKYTLKLNGFNKSVEVFEGCKAIKKKDPSVFCYVVHDVN